MSSMVPSGRTPATRAVFDGSTRKRTPVPPVLATFTFWPVAPAVLELAVVELAALGVALPLLALAPDPLLVAGGFWVLS